MSRVMTEFTYFLKVVKIIDHSNTTNCRRKYNAGKKNLPFLSDDVDPAYLVHYFSVVRSSPSKNLAGFFHSLLSFPGHIKRLGGLSRGPYDFTNTICPPKVGSIDLEQRRRTTERSVFLPLGTCR